MTDWENYESGPFCRHWGDPVDCDTACTRCGHHCCRHEMGDKPCPCFDCGCEDFTEPE